MFSLTKSKFNYENEVELLLRYISGSNKEIDFPDGDKSIFGRIKEISLKNLSKIIHARVVEIVEQVFAEIKAYGHENANRKLIAGIVLTGGGAQLLHIKQLVEYITGMDTRIGYPNEHLAGNSDPEISSPLYATAVGLMMNSIENKTQSAIKIETVIVPNVVIPVAIPIVKVEEPIEKAVEEAPIAEIPVEEKPVATEKFKILDFSRYLVKIKEFLDNAE